MNAIALYAKFCEQYQKNRPPLGMTPLLWNDLTHYERMAWEWLASLIASTPNQHMYEQQRENIVKLLEEVRSLKAQKEQDQKAWTVWKNKYEEMSKQNERCNKVIAEYERKAWSEVNGSLPLDRRAKLDKAHESLKEMVSSGMIHSGVTSLLKDILDLFEPDPKLWFWLGSSVQAEADKQTGFVGSAPDLPPGTVCQRKK